MTKEHEVFQTKRVGKVVIRPNRQSADPISFIHALEFEDAYIELEGDNIKVFNAEDDYDILEPNEVQDTRTPVGVFSSQWFYGFIEEYRKTQEWEKEKADEQSS